jgi:hypothetical protein
MKFLTLIELDADPTSVFLMTEVVWDIDGLYYSPIFLKCSGKRTLTWWSLQFANQ